MEKVEEIKFKVLELINKKVLYGMCVCVGGVDQLRV